MNNPLKHKLNCEQYPYISLSRQIYPGFEGLSYYWLIRKHSKVKGVYADIKAFTFYENAIVEYYDLVFEHIGIASKEESPQQNNN